MSAISTISYPKPRNYSKSGHTLYTAQGGSQKRTSLVLMGASVAWGDGLDMTQTYAYKMQSAIDTYLHSQGWRQTTLGGWVPRYIHTDDLQEGGPAAGGTPTAYPWPNSSGGTPGYSYPYNGSQANPGWGAGIDSPSFYNINPLRYPYTNAGTSYGRSKLNYDSAYGSDTAPYPVDAGIFGASTYGGDKNATYTNGCVSLQGSGQNLRFAVNFVQSTGYVQLKLTNPTGSTSVIIIYAATGFPGGASTFWTATTPNTSIVTTSGVTTQISMPPNTTTTILLSWTTVVSGDPQGISLNWNTGTTYVEVIAPLDGVQASNHILTQVCARNSYCLQDYNHSAVLDQVLAGVANSHVIDSADCDKPFFIVGDTYNSMVSNGPGGIPDRRLTPSQYATQLAAIGDYLMLNGAGQIILTMPILEQCYSVSSGVQYLVPINATNWIGGSNHVAAGNGTPGAGTGSPTSPQWSDFWQSIYNLAAARGWGFVDQSKISCTGAQGPYYINQTSPYQSNCYSINSVYTSSADAYPFQNDGLHPNDNFTTDIANCFITQLGLSGGS